MILVTWNVNGIRSLLRFLAQGTTVTRVNSDGSESQVTLASLNDFLNAFSIDTLCVQETKIDSSGLLSIEEDPKTPSIRYLDGYDSFWAHATVKQGYSGVCTWTKVCATSTTLNDALIDAEGRIVRSDHGTFTLLNIYFPNCGMGGDRIPYKQKFLTAIETYCRRLIDEERRDVILLGDLNIIPQRIDTSEKSNKFDKGDTACVLPFEREWFARVCAVDTGDDAGQFEAPHADTLFVDAFRSLHADEAGFTWRNVLKNCESFDQIGHRLDFALISCALWRRNVVRRCARIRTMIGSDHCPLLLDLDVPKLSPSKAIRTKRPNNILSMFAKRRKVVKQEVTVLDELAKRVHNDVPTPPTTVSSVASPMSTTQSTTINIENERGGANVAAPMERAPANPKRGTIAAYFSVKKPEKD